MSARTERMRAEARRLQKAAWKHPFTMARGTGETVTTTGGTSIDTIGEEFMGRPAPDIAWGLSLNK